jgi:arabinose-5-phosphate isomerase
MEPATILATARRVLEIEARAVAGLVDRLDGSFVRAVDMLVGCRGRVVVTGMGKSGIIGIKISATFASTGMPSHFLNPAEALHGDIGRIAGGDVVLALSNSGETDEIVRLLELIRRLDASIVGMSGNPESTLARHADLHLIVGVDMEACPLDLVPTASTTAFLAMGDALAVACYESRGFTAADFARFHPGGRLGRRLLRVRDLMHEGAGVPKVPETAELREAIAEMSTKRLGMTCVVGSDGRLVGILTDGDLRRLLMREAAPLDLRVADVMIRQPATIAPDRLAAEALAMMETRKITSLPAVDGDGALAGVIQIHDLWRTELF